MAIPESVESRQVLTSLEGAASVYHSQIASISKDGPARQFDIEIASSEIQLMVRDEINDLYGRQKRELWMISEQIDSVSEAVSKLSRVTSAFLLINSLIMAGLFAMFFQGAL